MLNHDRPSLQPTARGYEPTEKPDPMGDASLAHRLRAMGAVRPKHQSGETVEWVNAPLAVVVDQAYLAASGRITDVTHHDEDTLGKVHAALHPLVFGTNLSVTDVISAMQNAGILFRERVLSEFHCVICGSDEHDALGHPSGSEREQELSRLRQLWREGAIDDERYESLRGVLRGDEHVAVAEEHTHHTREARDQCAAGDHQYAKLLDDAAEREKVLRSRVEADETTMAEEPIENRLRRAYENGLKQGLELGHQAFGNWDHR